MDIKEIAAATWTNKAAGVAVAPLVRHAIDAHRVTRNAHWSTTRLLAALMPDATEAQEKNLGAHIQAARKRGLLDGYFAPHPTKKIFGSPLIQWGREAPAAAGSPAGSEDGDEDTFEAEPYVPATAREAELLEVKKTRELTRDERIEIICGQRGITVEQYEEGERRLAAEQGAKLPSP